MMSAQNQVESMSQKSGKRVTFNENIDIVPLERNSKARSSYHGCPNKGRKGTEKSRLYVKHCSGLQGRATLDDIMTQIDQFPQYSSIKLKVKPTDLKSRQPLRRNSYVRRSYHGFTNKEARDTQIVYFYERHGSCPRIPIGQDVVPNPNVEVDKDKFEDRIDNAYEIMKDASSRLKILRLDNKVSQEELENEVKLIHAMETRRRMIHYLQDHIGIPVVVSPTTYTEWKVHMTDIKFRVKKLEEHKRFDEHFLCVVEHDTDIRATSLYTLQHGYVTFAELFQYDIKVPDWAPTVFEINVTIFSIQEKPRSKFAITKELFKRILPSEIVESRFVSHGKMTLSVYPTQNKNYFKKDFDYYRVTRISELNIAFSMIQTQSKE